MKQLLLCIALLALCPAARAGDPCPACKLKGKPAYTTCGFCQGKGSKPDSIKRGGKVIINITRVCSECRGAGKLRCMVCAGTAQVLAMNVLACRDCNATGWYICHDCSGAGEVAKSQGLERSKWQRMPCRTCNQKGHWRCKACNGKQYVTLPVRLSTKDTFVCMVCPTFLEARLDVDAKARAAKKCQLCGDRKTLQLSTFARQLQSLERWAGADAKRCDALDELWKNLERHKLDEYPPQWRPALAQLSGRIALAAYAANPRYPRRQRWRWALAGWLRLSDTSDEGIARAAKDVSPDLRQAFDKADANHDGKVDAKELAASLNKKPYQVGSILRRHDSDRNGVWDPMEFAIWSATR